MSWIVAHVALVIAAIAIVATSALILQQRRAPQATLAWLLFVVLVPYLAVPVFLALGFRKQVPVSDLLAFGTESQQIVPACEAAPVDLLLRSYKLPGASKGNRFLLLDSGQKAFDELICLVDGAKESLDVTLYVLGDDPVGRTFVERLEQRAKDGVSVKVLLDRFGTLSRPKANLAKLSRAGGQVCLFSPFLHSPFRGHVNLRNHRKMVIADAQRVFSGGMNVAEEYLGPTPHPGRWRDLAFLLDGPAVSVFNTIFTSDWAATGGGQATPLAKAPPEPAGRSMVQLAPSGPDIPNDALHDALVYACYTAENHIWIATPYFLPTSPLSDALAIAARRDVDVKVIVPARSNQRLADLARGAFMRDLQEAGCRMFLCPGAMIHAKAVVIDDLAFIGSANIDIRSLFLNFEASLVLYDRDHVSKIAEWLRLLHADVREGMPPASITRQAIESVFRLGAPLL